MKPAPTSIDLFCGCGGFSLGLKQAGFELLAAIDHDPKAIEVFKANFQDIDPEFVLQRDLTTYNPEDLEVLIGTDRVDIIVGGPPCQGFSNARQNQGANHGPRFVEDPRRMLYQDFLRFVKHFQPSIFVMENVLGIRTCEGGQYFDRVHDEAQELGYEVRALVIKASDYGVPQKRQRQLFIGTKVPVRLPALWEIPSLWESGQVTLGHAIGDLPPVRVGSGKDPRKYDLQLRKKHYAKYCGHWHRQVLEINLADELTGHRARYHSLRDLDVFAQLKPGEHATQAEKRLGRLLDFPYNRGTFHDRYTRQHRDELCSTIVAHLAKDGLMFIHPTQNRSLTVREAARVQTFPDWFHFPVARTHQFRLIGNAVPPLVARAIATSLASKIAGRTEGIHFVHY